MNKEKYEENAEKTYTGLRAILMEFSNKDLLTDFAFRYGYWRPYLSNIANGYIRPDGYAVKGSYPQNLLILKDAKAFQKKIEKSFDKSV